mgnify:CR=1 FL=1
MHHTVPLTSQFYVTSPQPCPYLEGLVERKLFTTLQGQNADDINNALSKQGFRRSQNVLYRPACTDCSACLSARIDVQKFQLSKSQRRILTRNSNLKRQSNSPWATEAQFDLFKSYLDSRHTNGGMTDMDVFEFAAMIEETPINTKVIEYKNEKNSLDAVCLTDIFDDGVSLVYSFFNTEISKKSLGTYVILDHIQLAKEKELPYVYLGYWVQGSKKMAYKAQFQGVEVFMNGKWVSFEKNYDYESESKLSQPASLSDQVVQISMPNSTHIMER